MTHHAGIRYFRDMENTPELMTKSEYVAAQTELDRVSKLECANSLHRISVIEAAHLHHVRSAVWQGRNIHIDNWSDYRGYIPGLSGYTLNGNLAVFDSFKGTVWDKAKAYRQAVADAEWLESKRVRSERRLAKLARKGKR